MTSGNPIVDAIGEMNYEGNIVPHSWFNCPRLQFENGKPNMVAITLLSDIIYWYRPTVIRDERSNRIVEVRRKFKGHRLQKDYERWAEYFGFTKRQVQDAIAFLVNTGLIIREIMPPLNRPYFEPIPEAIYEVTFPDEASGRGITLERDTSHVETGQVSRSNGKGGTLEREISTESTTKNKHKALPVKKLDAKLKAACELALTQLPPADQKYVQQQAKMQKRPVEEVMLDLFNSDVHYALRGLK